MRGPTVGARGIQRRMQFAGPRAHVSGRTPVRPAAVSGAPRSAVGGRPSLLPFALILIGCAAGVAMIAVAFAGARRGRSWAEPLYWVGLLVIVLPVTVRLLGARAHRAERLALVALTSLSLYSAMVMLSPSVFPLHDELGAYRTVADILRSHHLYVPNPVDRAYSSYPGLGAVTAALASLSGLGIVPCGLFLIAVAKLLLVCGAFLFVERVTLSARIAGIAVLVYMTNPNFFFFDSQFAYESLALGLGAVLLWLTARLADDSTGTWMDVVAAIILDAALVLTHHLTSYAVAALITLWTGLALLRRRREDGTKRLLVLSAFALAATTAFLLHTLRATENDIGGSIVGSFSGLLHIISGQTAGRAPFHSAPGYTNPMLEQVVGIASVALLLAAWPFGLYAAWRERKRGLALTVLSIAAFMYPASLALRLTAAGNETSNRTSEFVFLGLGTVLALAFVILLGRWVDTLEWRGTPSCAPWAWPTLAWCSPAG